jgi:TPR repeat protein
MRRTQELVPVLAVLGTLAVMAACGISKSVRPDAPTASEAMGNRCDASAANSDVFVVDLPLEQRSDLELALGGEQLAVVAFDCGALELLKTCHASGSYSYRGTSPKQHVLSLDSADRIRAALPLGGAGIAATFEAEAGTGTKLDLGLLVAGQLVGSAASFGAAELTGECERATHVITGGQLGAFAMGTSARAELKTAAELFGAGIGASSTSSRLSSNRDGSLAACESATAHSAAPPEQCDALLALELSKVSASTSVEVDPAFWTVYGDLGCKDSHACEAACNDGKGRACGELGISLVWGGDEAGVEKNVPRGVDLLQKGCRLGDMRTCSALATILYYDDRADEALPLAQKSCNTAQDVDGCMTVGAILEKRGDAAGAKKAFSIACSAGFEYACGKAER